MKPTFYATKIDTIQAWNQAGNRLPVCRLAAPDLTVVQIKTTEKDGYNALVVARTKPAKRHSKPVAGQLKALSSKDYSITGELPFSTDQADSLKVGDTLSVSSFLAVGDAVSATGTSKGTGFTGTMKRWGFSGGPRTHGQSDRSRAPGSIGQGTTPGRVYLGKKMAGRSGGATTTVSNLTVVKVDDQLHQIWVKGTIPGHRHATIALTKTGTTTFPGLFQPAEVTTPSQPAVDSDSNVPATAETQPETTQPAPTTETTPTSETKPASSPTTDTNN